MIETTEPTVEVNVEKRTILYTGDITDKGAHEFSKALSDINAADDKKEKEVRDFFDNNHRGTKERIVPKFGPREPIKFYIESCGGSVWATNKIITEIKLSKADVHAYTFGKALSGGFYIYVTCKERFATQGTIFLYHDIASMSAGRLEDRKVSVQIDEETQKVLDNYVVKNTHIIQGKLDEMKTTVRDWWILGDEAKSFGIVDTLL